ncbi:MAG: DUF2948 family protein [Sphingomonadaceae bacterium]|nr:DUF2948 family protein [Sphingomonadaceae bacterium]
MPDAGLHLRADSPDGVRFLSALTQDAILSSADAIFDAARGVSALILSRYRWEDRGRRTRVRSLLTVRHVERATRLRWPSRASPLLLLSIRPAPAVLRLDFADAIALRLTTLTLALSLEDIGEPWPVRRVPGHERG